MQNSLSGNPHALGSHKDKKSATVQQYWKRFKCMTLILYDMTVRWTIKNKVLLVLHTMCGTHPGELQTKQPLSISAH